MKISEIFVSCQGEIDVGVPSLFIRVVGCDAKPKCKWCDSKFSFTSGKKYSEEELIKTIFRYNVHNIVWTGGSPSLYMEQIVAIVRRLTNYTHTLETNGIKYFHDCRFFNQVSVSPKKQCLNLDSLKLYNQLPNVRFKFVYESNDNIWIQNVINNVGIYKGKVWLMAEGRTRDEQLDRSLEVVEYCLKNGYNFTPRMHVLLWNKKRGV